MPNKPRVFIASATSSGRYAQAVSTVLKEDGKVYSRYWVDYFRRAGTGSTFEQLLRALDEFEYGVFILSGDDVLQLHDVTRSNVLLELGLFAGRHGSERVFGITSNEFNVQPSDLKGVNLYKWDAAEDDEVAAVRDDA